ncbi:MAG: RNA 3'-terminal phosphate cyclase [Candidatus Hydrothermarchaeota archaeon]|nr:RNA 3'-terminal phosphate cyclase [Candidatus Hydrothermarchaeota archaeon]
MIEIDGSYGEGGGQIMRTSLALASLIDEDLRIVNIRCKRPKPGLAQQHLASVRAIQEITQAKVEGAHLGSMELIFRPGEIKPGRYKIDIGTAGSISMVLQTLLPTCLFTEQPVELVIRGGTNVKWSPSVDYLMHVFLPIIGEMGVKGKIEIQRRGYYPRGGGIVKAIIHPIVHLRELNLLERGAVVGIKGIAHSSNLQCHIVERMAKAAKNKLNYSCNIELECGKGFSTGTGIVLWAVGENSLLGSGFLGEIGKKAEKVGEEASAKLIAELKTNAPLDSHMSDQVIPYLALAEGTSRVRVAELTNHLTTNIYVVEKILGLKFEITDEYIISVKGIGLRNE